MIYYHQLNSAYKAVVEIKTTSGFTWNDERGADITLESSNAWAAFAKVSTDSCAHGMSL